MMKWYYWVATVAYCAVIFFLSSRQDLPDAPVDIPSIDKMFHFVAYGGLAGLVSWGMRQSNESLAPRVQWVAPVLFAVLYGLSDEIHQLFVPHRAFDLWDLAADALGAVAAQWLLCGWWWRVPARHGTLS